ALYEQRIERRRAGGIRQRSRASAAGASGSRRGDRCADGGGRQRRPAIAAAEKAETGAARPHLLSRRHIDARYYCVDFGIAPAAFALDTSPSRISGSESKCRKQNLPSPSSWAA